MNKNCTNWTIINRSNGITYRFKANEIYFGKVEENTLTLYEKGNGEIIVVADDKFYNNMRVELFKDKISFKKEFFKHSDFFNWFPIKDHKWFKENLLSKKIFPEEIVEL